MIINYFEERPYICLVLVGLLLFFFNLSALPVSIMEARNFVVAREMITLQNWILTTMNGLPRYEKPPLPSWITSFFIAILNYKDVWIYRLPVSVMATLGLIGSYKISFALSNLKRLSLYTALILGTSYYYLVIRFEAPTDMFTHVFMMFSIFHFIKLCQVEKAYKHSIWGGLWLGASILSKGPVGIYALLLPFIISYFIIFKGQYTLKWKSLLIYLFLGFSIGISWYLYVRFTDAEAFNNIATKETNNWSSYNVRPFYYYWSFFLQSGIWAFLALVSLVYPYFKDKVTDKKLYLFSMVWTLSAVILLSLIPEKKARYLVPVLIPLALNTAQIIYHLSYGKLCKIDQLINKIQYAIIIMVIGAFLIAPFFIFQYNFQFWIWYSGIFISIMLLLVSVIKQLKTGQYHNIIWNYIAITVIITSIGTSAIAFLKKNDAYKSLQSVEFENNKLPAFYYDHIEPEIIFEFGKTSKLLNFETLDNFPALILVPSQFLDDFKKDLPQGLKLTNESVFDRNYFATSDEKKYKPRYKTHIFVVTN